MFLKWMDEYKLLSEKMKFFSRASSFLLSILAIFSLGRMFWWVWIDITIDKDILKIFIFALAFHLIVAISFSARFALSFSKLKTSEKNAQILWFVSFMTIAFYCFYSLNSYLEARRFGLLGGPPPLTLIWVDNTFSLFCWFYLITCVIKIFVLSLISFFKIRKIEN